MRLRHQDVERPVPPAGQADSAGDRAEQREAGATLLAAADDAITRALSRNSAEFLAQNRQSGGQ
jgi:hypothetical protein